MSLDLSTIEKDVNVAEQIAEALVPFLALVPGISAYIPAIAAVLPQVVKATNAVEQTIGHPVGSDMNTQVVADHMDPTAPVTPIVGTK